VAWVHACLWNVSLRAVDLASKKEKSQTREAFQASHFFLNHNTVGFSRETEQFASFSSMVKTIFLGKH